MLTLGEIDYLKKIPNDKTAKIYPFDPKAATTAEEIINSIKKVYPNLEIRHLGASALKISGQNDLDIYCLADPKHFDSYLPGLTKLFGKPLHKHEESVEWPFQRDGFDVELYLTDPNSEPMKRQIRVFEILKNDPALLSEYENLKRSMNGKSFREYQRKKYEFYHKILDEK